MGPVVSADIQPLEFADVRCESQSVLSPNVVRLWAMVLLIGGERGKDLMRSKNGRLRCGEFVSIVSWSM